MREELLQIFSPTEKEGLGIVEMSF